MSCIDMFCLLYSLYTSQFPLDLQNWIIILLIISVALSSFQNPAESKKCASGLSLQERICSQLLGVLSALASRCQPL